MPFSDRELRQIALLKRQLESYESRALALPTLIADVSALINELEEVDFELIEKLRRQWEELEETYAIMIDLGRDQLNEAETQVISAAVSELRQLVATIESNA